MLSIACDIFWSRVMCGCVCCVAALVEMNARSLSLTATFQRTIAALAGGGSDAPVPVRGV